MKFLRNLLKSITTVKSSEKNERKKHKVTQTVVTPVKRASSKSDSPDLDNSDSFMISEFKKFLIMFFGNQPDINVFANEFVNKMDKIYGPYGIEQNDLNTAGLKEFIQALGKKKDAESIIKLIKLTKKNPNVQYSLYASDQANNALRELGPIGSFIALFLQDESSSYSIQYLPDIVNDLITENDFNSIVSLLEIIKNNELPDDFRIAAIKNIPENDKAATEVFNQILTTKQSGDLKNILKAYIGIINKDSIDEILGIIKNSDDYSTVLKAIQSMKELKDNRVIEPLINMIKNKPSNWEGVKEEAFAIIGELKDSNAVEPLINLLGKDEYYSFLSEAANTLKKIGNPSVNPLIEVLKGNKDDYVRSVVARTLGDIADHRAIDQLLFTLNENTEVEDEYSDVRRASLYGLFQMKDHLENWTELLISVLDNDKDPNISRDVIRELGDIGDIRAVSHLLNAYSNSSVEDKWWITIALSQIGDREALAQIRKVCRENPSFMPPIYSFLSEEREICDNYLGNLKDQTEVVSIPKFNSVVCMRCGSYLKSTFELFEIKEDEVFCHKGEFMGGQLTCEKCGEKYEVHFHLKELKVQRLTVKIDDNIPKEMIFYSN